MKTFITNVKTLGSFVNNSNELVEVDVLVEDGMIKQIGESLDVTGVDDFINGNGHFLAPGLIDPQVHFREPGLEYKEDIESGSKTAAKGGFTTVISMPNTTPTADNFDTVKFMWDKQKEVGLCRVYPTGAVTFGLKGEAITDFSKLKEAGAIALTDDGRGIQSDEVFKEAMIEAAKLNLAILDHSEDESLSLGGAIHKGEHSKKYGVKGIDSMSESVHVERGCRLSGETGCHYHVLHISTKESIEHVRIAKSKGHKVTAEVSPHHLILCDEDIPEREAGHLDPNWKMNPPLRSKEDRQACIEALMDGTIDAVATDHAPHAPHEKAKEIHEAPFGIIGLETAFPLMYTDFVKTGKISLERLVHLMTKGAADIFNLPLGTLDIGAPADITILDIENSEMVISDSFASKSKNSPFIGRELFGHAKLTLLQGKIVYNTLD
jgi:dihydroorotase